MSLPDEPKKLRCKALDSNYGTGKKSKKQENRLAKHLKGRRQPGSGSQVESHRKVGDPEVGCMGTGLGSRLRYKPGDVVTDLFLIEAKRTDKKSLSIKGEWLTKIEGQAARLGKYPALAIEIGDRLVLDDQDWIAMPRRVFDALLFKGDDE